MGRNRHKRKNSHVVIVTSDAADVGAKQYRIRPWIIQVFTLIICVIIGALIGYFMFEKDMRENELQQTVQQNDAIAVLGQEKAELEEQIAVLNGQIADLNEQIALLDENNKILSDTVAQKVRTEDELRGQLEKQSLPTEFPLTSGATMEDPPAEGEPICIFTVASGSMVVATAKGTVVVVNDDPEYGHNVWVEHESGYTTIYRCPGEVKVKAGETVNQGATLILISEQGSKLGYQMIKGGEYVDPMEMLNISG